MTLDELFGDCWRALPPVRKNWVGKDATKKVFVDALKEWDSESLGECKDTAAIQGYETTLLARVRKRRIEDYGFAVVVFILMAVASAVIQWLVLWWLNHGSQREDFEKLRVGL